MKRRNIAFVDVALIVHDAPLPSGTGSSVPFPSPSRGPAARVSADAPVVPAATKARDAVAAVPRVAVVAVLHAAAAAQTQTRAAA